MTAQQRPVDPTQRLMGMDSATRRQTEIDALIEPYRGELLLHCYRLLGSLFDAEDAVQEAMLRAWRHFDTFSFRGPGSLRAWLYTLATNTSLDALKKRSPRIMPTSAYPASDPLDPTAPRNTEILWLEPFPDAWLAEATENPETRYTRQESISLAFLTALQLLPPRQRAILILAEVLDWRANEIARLLEISVSAVNSALHRARVTLEQNYRGAKQKRTQPSLPDETTNTLLARYLHAWENDDVDGLVALLKEDATLSMPPVPSWYQGREALRAIFRTVIFPADISRRWRLMPTRVNGQPGFAVYQVDPATGRYHAHTVQVLTLTHSRQQIADITAFIGPSFVTRFGFPPELAR